MARFTYFPVGAPGKIDYVSVSTGDVIELVTGEKVTFNEMKRTKWNGTLNGKGIIVPIYRDRMGTVPYAKAIVGRDESVIVKSTPISKFKVGDLFYLDGHKETFMYAGTKQKRGGKEVVWARDLATKKMYTIQIGMTMVKIDLNQAKQDLIEKLKTL